MAHSRLDQYKGRLTAAQLAEGMNAATENARHLVRDAVMLLEAGRFPTAASLAALAIEEAGKPAILCENLPLPTTRKTPQKLGAPIALTLEKIRCGCSST
jgi:hypothetical protein